MAISCIRIYFFRIVARAEKVIAEADEIIVDPPAVEGKETHKCNHVPEFRKHPKISFANPVVIDDEVKS